MNIVNKKSVIKIILYFLLFSLIYYFMFYTEKSNQKNQIYEYGDTDNTYKIALTSDMSEGDMFKSICTVLSDYNANISIFISNNETNKTEIIEYVFISDTSYFDSVRISDGRFLTQKDNCSDLYVSSKNNNDVNQIGTIDIFPCDIGLTIKAINPESIPDELFNKYVHLNVKNADDYISITSAFESLGISVTLDESDVSNGFLNIYIILIPIFLAIICISLSLYEVLNSYKKIAIKKLLGKTDFQIFLQWVGNSVACMVIAASISFVVCFLLLVREFRISCLVFMGKVLRFDLFTVMALSIVVSIPFVYIRKIKPSEMLRNKKPVVAIESMNFLFKVCVGTVSVLMFVASVSSYQIIMSFLQDRYSNWYDTKDYYVVSTFATSYEEPEDPKLQESSYKAYCYLNQNGAVLADFYDYSEDVYNTNMENLDNVEYKAAWATVNPNYLKKFTIFDEFGNAVEISESDENLVALVPVKYKNLADDISAYYKKVLNEKLTIIWTANGQEAFTYRIDLNPSNGNCITDPILMVLTEGNTSMDKWYYVEGYMGEPIKIKALTDDITAKDDLLQIYNQYYDTSACSLKLSNIYSSVESDIEQIKISSYWILGICTAFVVLLIFIILQCLYLYFEERKQSIAVMRLLGINIFQRYVKLFEDVLASWVGILIISFLINRSIMVVIVSAICFVLEILGLLICVKCNETKRIVNVLKNK